MSNQIKKRERNAIIKALASGVVPPTGLQYIAVGRERELDSFTNDIDDIAEGGTAFRLVVGEYGSGKTFFIYFVKNIAIQKDLVTINADLGPNTKIYTSTGPSLLYRKLIASACTREYKNGGALRSILENFITRAKKIAQEKFIDINYVIDDLLRSVNDLSMGSDFARVIKVYWHSYQLGNSEKMESALKWLRGEYDRKSQAKTELGVSSIIEGKSFYESIKLFAVMVKQAGYKGLLVCLDEIVNLYKITNSVSRKSNYELVLHMLNDTLQQGNNHNIGFIMGGTPECVTDEKRGLYSYDALKTRLYENSIAQENKLIDCNSTILRLNNLIEEDIIILLKKVQAVFYSFNEQNYVLSEEDIINYLKHCSSKIGDEIFLTPRNTIKAFVNLLSTLQQNPESNLQSLLNGVDIIKEQPETELGQMMQNRSVFTHTNDVIPEEDVFASLKL